ncbi:MAG: hypothetical protein J0L81_07775 [Caulobacterales bacterium]|jgi:hypothetical protein|nr:hypothetical protein [Caulobacterales bacterium]
MRFIFVTAAFAAAFALAAFDAPRTSGVYATTPLANAQACASACEADSLCMAWTFAERSCALRANVPAEQSAASGVSARAPLHLRPSAPTPPLPEPRPAAVATPSQQPQREPAMLQNVQTAELLGGPEEDPTALRR